MNKQLFDELAESVREAGKIHRSRLRNPEVKTVPRKADDFVTLAGSVSVPPECERMSWPEIKASTWRRRAKARK